MTVRRLVILGDSLTALAVARDAARKGLDAHVVDHGRGLASKTRVATVHRLEQMSDDATALALLGELCSSSSCALIATDDGWLRFVMRNRAALGGIFTHVLHAANESLAICLDKGRFAQWCSERGLSTPAYVLGFPDALESVRYPVLVRPAQTLHGVNQTSVPKAAETSSAAELRPLLWQFSAARVQPLISESLLRQRIVQYSVPAVRAPDGMVSFVARKRRPPPDWCAVGTLVELHPCGGAESLARAALDALDYYGIAEVEVLYSEDTHRYYLVEINARPWIQYPLAPASGHDFLGMLLESPSHPATLARKEGLQWIDFCSDLYVCFSRTRGLIPRKALGVAEYFQSLLRVNVFSRFALRDPWPFLYSVWSDLLPLWRGVRVRLWDRSARGSG